MHKCNYVVYNYMDDIMGIGPESTVFDSLYYLLQLLQNLGFPISTSKSTDGMQFSEYNGEYGKKDIGCSITETGRNTPEMSKYSKN